jgi:hypothetical protein
MTKKCKLVCDKKEYTFYSYAKASEFLGRSHSYISEKIKQGGKIYSKDGVEYVIVC